MRGKLNPMLLIGLIGLFTVGINVGITLARIYAGNENIWWTPHKLALPLEDAQSSFVVLVREVPMKLFLDSGQLAVRAADGECQVLQPGDVRVRLNNWQKTRAQLMQGALISCFALGMILIFLLWGIVEYRKEKKQGP